MLVTLSGSFGSPSSAGIELVTVLSDRLVWHYLVHYLVHDPKLGIPLEVDGLQPVEAL